MYLTTRPDRPSRQAGHVTHAVGLVREGPDFRAWIWIDFFRDFNQDPEAEDLDDVS